MSRSQPTLISTSHSRTGTFPALGIYAVLERTPSGTQALQGEAGPGAPPTHLSRQPMRRDWTKSKFLERSELSCSSPRQHPLHTPAQWWRDGLPCTRSSVFEAGLVLVSLTIRGKDIGNTNFSIHLPRGSFNRHVTAQLVLRAVRALDVDASVNDRNDVCVGPYKMSLLS